MISLTDLIALGPLLALIATTIAAMLAIAFHRHHGLTFRLTVVGLVVALALVPVAAGLAPRAVTPLLLVDHYALCFMALVLASGLAISVLCRDYLPSRSDQPEEFYLLLLTTLLGAAVLAVAKHFASFFLGLETLSVSLFAMIAYPYRDLRALEAGIKYLVLSGTATGLLVFGMALVYAQTGTLEFGALPAPVAESFLAVTGVILIIAALAFKLSLVPFHLWTPDVYQGAPVPVSALLATVSKGAVFILLLRYALADGLVKVPVLADILALLAATSMLAGNLLALRQNNLKRLIGYSSIAHMGYLLIVLVAAAKVGGDFAAEALLFYLTAYFVTTLAVFAVMAVMSRTGGEAEHLDDYAGLFRSRPWLATVLAVAVLSLAGIPLTAGFVGKFYLFAAGGEGGLWGLMGLLIVGSGLGLFYYLRILAQLVREGNGVKGAEPAVPLAGSVVLAVLLVLMLGLGIYPGSFIDLLLPAAAALH